MGSNADERAEEYRRQSEQQFGGASSAFSGGAMDAVNDYRDVLAGKKPSIAEQQLRKATDQNIAQQMAIMASQRGRDPGVAARQAAQNAATAQQTAAGDAAMLRLNEQNQARNALMGGYGNVLGIEQAKNAAQQAGAAQGKAEDENSIWNIGGKVASGIAGVGSMLFSDENLKTNKEPAVEKITAFLNALEPKNYEYKEGTKAKKQEKGKKVSVMAQDLEKSEIGKKMVKNTPDGKMVDYAKGAEAAIAALANIHKRLKKLEK